MIRDRATLRADSIAYLTGQGSTLPRPVAVGEKFTPEGVVMRYTGNTFICHIPPESAAHRALTDASLALQAGPLAEAYTFLPPSSFHMTVFEGATDAHRADARWPQDLPADLQIEAVTDRFAERIRQLSLPDRVTIRSTGLFGGFSVAVTGATEADEASLRNNRVLLRAATGINRPDFESYGFHITLAYLLRWLTLAEAEAVMDLSEHLADELQGKAPEIALNRVEFCAFDDMHAFHTLARL